MFNNTNRKDGPDPEGPAITEPGKPGGKRRVLVALGAAALLAGGTWFGSTLPDPTASDQYAALAHEKTGVEAGLKSLQSEYESLNARYITLESGIEERESKAAAREAEVGKAEAALKTAQAAVKKREDAVTAAEKTQAANTVGDGTWTVGTDIKPGTYRATDNVGSTCYWGIYRSGSNGDDIIENDIPGGGRPVVTLSPGQDFKSTRCGTWLKQ